MSLVVIWAVTLRAHDGSYPNVSEKFTTVIFRVQTNRLNLYKFVVFFNIITTLLNLLYFRSFKFLLAYEEMLIRTDIIP
jgi:hypothetical protein